MAEITFTYGNGPSSFIDTNLSIIYGKKHLPVLRTFEYDNLAYVNGMEIDDIESANVSSISSMEIMNVSPIAKIKRQSDAITIDLVYITGKGDKSAYTEDKYINADKKDKDARNTEDMPSTSILKDKPGNLIELNNQSRIKDKNGDLIDDDCSFSRIEDKKGNLIDQDTIHILDIQDKRCNLEDEDTFDLARLNYRNSNLIDPTILSKTQPNYSVLDDDQFFDFSINMQKDMHGDIIDPIQFVYRSYKDLLHTYMDVGYKSNKRYVDKISQDIYANRINRNIIELYQTLCSMIINHPATSIDPTSYAARTAKNSHIDTSIMQIYNKDSINAHDVDDDIIIRADRRKSLAISDNDDIIKYSTKAHTGSDISIGVVYADNVAKAAIVSMMDILSNLDYSGDSCIFDTTTCTKAFNNAIVLSMMREVIIQSGVATISEIDVAKFNVEGRTSIFGEEVRCGSSLDILVHNLDDVQSVSVQKKIAELIVQSIASIENQFQETVRLRIKDVNLDDIIDIPSTDYKYEEIVLMAIDNYGNSLGPASEIAGSRILVNMPNNHYSKDYADIGLIQVPVKLLHLKDVLLIIFAMKNEYKLQLAGTDPKTAINFILENLYYRLNILKTEASGALDSEYDRAFRLVRWYGESAVMRNSRYLLMRDYNDYIAPLHRNDIQSLDYVVENDGFTVVDGALTNSNINNAIEIEFTSHVEANTLIIFKTVTAGSGTGIINGKIIIDEDTDILPLNTVNEKEVLLAPGNHNIRIEAHSSKIYITTLKLGGTKAIGTPTTEYIPNSADGLKVVNDLNNMLINYFVIHHDYKKKGSRTKFKKY